MTGMVICCKTREPLDIISLILLLLLVQDLKCRQRTSVLFPLLIWLFGFISFSPTGVIKSQALCMPASRSRENHSSGPRGFDLQRKVMVTLSDTEVVVFSSNDWGLYGSSLQNLRRRVRVTAAQAEVKADQEITLVLGRRGQSVIYKVRNHSFLLQLFFFPAQKQNACITQRLLGLFCLHGALGFCS